jgi:hypothetical protein
MSSNFFLKLGSLSDNMEKPGTAKQATYFNITQRMRIA